MEKRVNSQTVGQVALISFEQVTVDPEFIKAFDQVMDTIEMDNEVRVVLITGAQGNIFFSGYDLGLLGKEPDTAVLVGRVLEVQQLMNRIENYSKPVIGVINGYALGGGCEMAMACDMVYASERAVFGTPEVRVGLIPAAGGTIRLPRIAGKHKALEMILTGKTYSAQQAKEMGIVNEVFHHDELINEALKIANLIAANAPVAIKIAKANVNSSNGLLDKQLQLLAAEGCAECLKTDDIKEGVAAFFAKRKPRFIGR